MHLKFSGVCYLGPCNPLLTCSEGIILLLNDMLIFKQTVKSFSALSDLQIGTPLLNKEMNLQLTLSVFTSNFFHSVKGLH